MFKQFRDLRESYFSLLAQFNIALAISPTCLKILVRTKCDLKQLEAQTRYSQNTLAILILQRSIASVSVQKVDAKNPQTNP